MNAPRVAVCRSPLGLRRLRALRLPVPMLVASDDSGVREAATLVPGVAGVVPLERPEPFYAVAPEVLARLRRINGWLESFAGPGAGAETLSWGQNVEGGMTCQRVQDCLLLIRSGRELLSRTGAKELHLVGEPGTDWEDAVLARAAAAGGVPVFLHPGTGPGAAAAARLRSRLRAPAMAAYQLGHLLLRRATGRGKRFAPAPPDAAFQLCSSWEKHIANVAPLMAALKGRGLSVLALCWTSSERLPRVAASAALSRRGLAAVDLEACLTAADLVGAARTAQRLGRGIRRAAAADPGWCGPPFLGVELAPLLGDSLRHFLVAELPQRLRHGRALDRALPGLRPRAFKPWAGPESFEGRAALARWPRPLRPKVFHYWLGANLEWPYAAGAGELDLFLAKGAEEARHAAREYALEPGRVRIVGQARLGRHAEFARAHPASESRRRLGLPASGALYLGFDPGGIVRGYQSAGEQAEMAGALLDAARARPDVVLVVKPHPAYPIDALRPLLERGGPARVAVLAREASVLDFLNAVDLVVTKYSTLILEASLMGRPSISALFDGEDRFRVYGDIPSFARSRGELAALVGTLATDRGAFEAWRRDELERHRRLLPGFYHRGELPPELAAAAAVHDLIRAPDPTCA